VFAIPPIRTLRKSMPIMAFIVGVIGDFIEARYFILSNFTYSTVEISSAPPSAWKMLAADWITGPIAWAPITPPTPVRGADPMFLAKFLVL